jgi:alcohol dehydrogenase (cytochrome c)
MRHLWSGLPGVALVTVACAGTPKATYPITQESRPFNELDLETPGRAPDVAAKLTSDRLEKARSEPDNWLTYYGTYDGQRFSALKQIDSTNVKGLRPAWAFQAGVIGLIATPASFSFEATPIVVDGVMFVSGWDGYVWALDAGTGKQLWRYRHAVPLDTPLCCGNVNRGVAVVRGKVFVATPNGHLVALNAVTGRPAWIVPFVDVRAGESATMAPLIAKDRILVGSSGAEYGVRGHIDAFDLDGKHLWRRYNVPKPGEPGSETWPSGDAWQRGGGTAWVTGTYDPELGLAYWGTGNAGPDFNGDDRKGANLYTDSIIAFRPETGQLVWHYQTTPHDVWDYDGVNENILFEQGGQKLLAHFDKNGYLFILDRRNGKLVRAAPFARASWGQIDSTGRVTPKLLPTEKGVEICPGPAGAKEWPHASFSRDTGFLYAPVIEKCGVFKSAKQEFKESLPYWGGGALAQKQPSWGYLKAIDPATGNEVWAHKTKHPMVASVLTTAGNLVFVGEPTGEFDAFDAKTGQLLWQFQTGSGIHASPVTYSIDGKQYVAIATGWGGWMKGFAPELYGGNRGSALMVFSLP